MYCSGGFVLFTLPVVLAVFWPLVLFMLPVLAVVVSVIRITSDWVIDRSFAPIAQ